MEYKIRYKPAFAAIFITLAPGESITAESGAMTSMDGRVFMKTKFSGGFFQGLVRKFFGGESLFVNVFSNNTQQPLKVVLTQSVIGDIECIDLSSAGICIQKGAYIAHTGGVKIGVRWAGFSSWFAKEGLFKLKLSGRGKVFFGAYGGLTKKRISGEFVVDNSHLVAYEPGIRMKIGLAGGLVSSVTSGEGFVTRLSGNGNIYLQSRSIDALVGFLRPKVR
ncbi:MAG: TIGR00266 family protein [Moorea sp. SIO2B7]|nr:TIGR00266 family protein [Moorena sp. SIO2B7]